MKARKDPVRENRIHEEAIVDAYGPEEKAMSWYYYLEGKLSFPFRARCTASKITSPLKKGQDVEVMRMAPDEAFTSDILVMVRWRGGNSPFRWHNSPPLPPTNQPKRQSATGIIGCRRAICSDFHRRTQCC